MIFSRLKSGVDVTDDDFDTIYSSQVKKISEFHFTPVEVAKTAAQFLVNRPSTKLLYELYNQHMKAQLSKMPIGTRLATYFSYAHEVPSHFKVQSTGFDGKLKLWEKIT